VQTKQEESRATTLEILSGYSIISTAVHVPKQVAVAIIKPDAVKAGLVDDIIKKVH